MQKRLLIVLCIPLLFTTCQKDVVNPYIDNTSSNIKQIIIDKIWKGRVPDFTGSSPFGNDIIFELSSNDSLYIYTSGCTQTTTNIGTWNISGKIITYNQVINSIEYTGLSFGELTEYSETQLKFKVDSNINAICEIYNSTQNCTYIPDNNFEQFLINQGLDNIMDNYALTSDINTLAYLDVNNQNITSLTGIEGFTSLTSLLCYDNQLTSLDLSQNTALISLYCENNQLTSLDLSQNTAIMIVACLNNQLTSLDMSNSNNTIISYLNTYNNPFLNCIEVDDVAWSTANWTMIDPQHYFSEGCSNKH